MIAMKTSLLSCKQEESQSFLSCALRHRNSLPNTRKHNRKVFAASTLSCHSSTARESESEIHLGYRENKKILKRSLIIGVDPGIFGALAMVSIGEKPEFVAVFDMPTHEVKTGKKTKNRVDLEALSFLIESYSKDIILSLVEEVGQIGTNADPFSSFVFGFATGGLHGVLTANDVKIKTVHPLTWKGSMGLDADKAKSIAKAIKFFPQAEKFLSRKKDHGRAEALLLAYWGNQFINRESR